MAQRSSDRADQVESDPITRCLAQVSIPGFLLLEYGTLPTELPDDAGAPRAPPATHVSLSVLSILTHPTKALRSMTPTATIQAGQMITRTRLVVMEQLYAMLVARLNAVWTSSREGRLSSRCTPDRFSSLAELTRFMV